MSNKKRELTELQERFLACLMDEAKGDIREALRLAGYNGTRPYDIVKSLREEIIDVAKNHLALSAPKASHKLTDVLDNPSLPSANNLMKAATEVLNRAGANAPKEDVNLRVPEGGLFIMPAKHKIVEEQEEESE